MTSVLFLCSTNTARSQMAEGFARAKQRQDVDIISAGTAVGKLHPMAVRVMGEVGIDISGQAATSLEDLNEPTTDIVVALCDRAAEACPLLPGRPLRVNWSLPDPAAIEGDEAAVLRAFRNSRDEIRRLVDDLFDRGYLAALADARRCESLILDNIHDGILAHDTERHIFFFNQAAEDITGYSSAEVVRKDCHDVFPGNFCGGKCLFCELGEIPEFDVVTRELEIATKSGERRVLDSTVRWLYDDKRAKRGVLVVFRDATREKRLERRVQETQQFAGIIGRDEKMLEMFDLIRDLAETTVPVLIQGESGTGKELVAAAIHNEGPRANREFVPVNCGALPESLLESELFGHVKGAFTGAIRDKKGRFELADGGTIFLDEIGDISQAMQVKLMRVLQEGTFERVGSEKTLKVDVRLISATNKDLIEEIQQERFREDLYYRLSVVPVWLPPLRERRNDIPLLVNHVLNRAMADAGKRGITVSPEAMDVMLAYEWPGNVRELQNWIQFALLKCKQTVILPEHLPPARGAAPAPSRRRRRRKLDIESVRAALRRTQGNKMEAAQELGVSRATLYRFLDDVGGID